MEEIKAWTEYGLVEFSNNRNLAHFLLTLLGDSFKIAYIIGETQEILIEIGKDGAAIGDPDGFRTLGRGSRSAFRSIHILIQITDQDNVEVDRKVRSEKLTLLHLGSVTNVSVKQRGQAPLPDETGQKLCASSYPCT